MNALLPDRFIPDDYHAAADKCPATAAELFAFAEAHDLDAWQCMALANVGALR